MTVELAAGGAIVDLTLTSQAMAKTPETLASTILEAIRSGLAEVAERTSAEVAPLTGRRVDVAAIAQGRLPELSQPATGPRSESRVGPAAAAAVTPAPALDSSPTRNDMTQRLRRDDQRAAVGRRGSRRPRRHRRHDRDAAARSADVDTVSWGALGLALGLYDGYSSARSSAHRSIGEVRSFLTAARAAVEASARDYDAADQAATELFTTITSTLADGS